MSTTSETFDLAFEHHQAGRLVHAEQVYQEILRAHPDHADALHLLGLVWHQQDKHEAAIESIGRAIALQPRSEVFHSNLGAVYHATHRFGEAIDCYWRALQIKPEHVSAHKNLGITLRAQREQLDLVTKYQRTLERKPQADFAEACANLGNVFRALGKLDHAVVSYQQSIRRKANSAEAYNGLGMALKALGNLEQAIASYRHALQLNPNLAAVYNNLGNALTQQGNLQEAVNSFRRALELSPNTPQVHFNLGFALVCQQRTDEAIPCYQRALQLKPDYAAAHNNLGDALKHMGRFDEAVACFQRLLRLKPDFAEAHSNLGNALKDQGKPSEAIECYRRALELKRDYPEAHSNLLLTLHYPAGASLSALADAHAEYERRHAAPLHRSWKPHGNIRDRDLPLRLGFLSPDLGVHPVGCFLIRVLEHLDRTQSQVICYSDRIARDKLTSRLQAATTTWSNVAGWSDERLAQQIRDDKIDVLFDLAGHTARNRLLVFARKPAPMQITWIGYVGTTGLTAMDYILADRYEIPAQAEKHYCERVLRMPHGYVCYDPPGYAPPVSELPAQEEGGVTFGSFNNPAKITSQVVEVWAKILARVPQSRLVLKYLGMDDSSIAGHYAELFSGHGVDPVRVTFLNHSPHAELLGEYHRIDIALDPFPYGGGLTTCEALWMGVPVITCPGDTFASRHSLSHLSNVGLTETVARDLSDYVDLATGLAHDLPRLAKWRAGLRGRMESSPLCDGPRFARNLTNILQTAWREWCDSIPSGSPTRLDSTQHNEAYVQKL